MVLDNNFIKSESFTDLPLPLQLITSVKIIKGTYKGAFGEVTKLHDKKVEVFIAKIGKTVRILKSSVLVIV